MNHPAPPRPELIAVADAVAREKGIARDVVFEAMEEAIARAGRSLYGAVSDVVSTVDRRTGAVQMGRRFTVVANDAVVDQAREIGITAALARVPGAVLGGFVIEPLPPVDFGRVAAQGARQVIIQKVREAERQRVMSEYQERVGEVVSGTVKREDFGGVIVDLGRAEALLPRRQSIPRESFRVGDRVRAVVQAVRAEQRGPVIFLSRTDPAFLVGLFSQEVPEVYNGTVVIRAVARDPGSRAKVAVVSNDSSIDPVGTLIGPKGARVRPVVEEMAGERVDIIHWTDDVAKLVCDAMAPAEVSKVVIDEEAGSIEVVVPDDQKSLAIGRRGQNVRLASELVGMRISISGETEESSRRNEDDERRCRLFEEALDVDDVIARLLVAEGFDSLELVAGVSVDELAEVEGFESIAEELQRRARAWLATSNEQGEARRIELGVEDAVAALSGVDAMLLASLGEAGAKTLDDVADLCRDELLEIANGRLDAEQADKIIMAARAHWFEGEATPAA